MAWSSDTETIFDPAELYRAHQTCTATWHSCCKLLTFKQFYLSSHLLLLT